MAKMVDFIVADVGNDELWVCEHGLGREKSGGEDVRKSNDRSKYILFVYPRQTRSPAPAHSGLLDRTGCPPIRSRACPHWPCPAVEVIRQVMTEGRNGSRSFGRLYFMSKAETRHS